MQKRCVHACKRKGKIGYQSALYLQLHGQVNLPAHVIAVDFNGAAHIHIKNLRLGAAVRQCDGDLAWQAVPDHQGRLKGQSELGHRLLYQATRGQGPLQVYYKFIEYTLHA